MQRCAECGTEFPANVPPGLCPHCVLSDDLESAAVEMPPLPRSFGDYELLDEIARGGMGVVYRARQKSLDRIVAVKMLRSGSQADFDTIRRFRVEAVAAGSLKHPNIVPIHEVGEYDGRRFIVMDYVAGGNLALHANKPLPPKRAAELLVTISSAIHYAHQHRVLHRDLKPSNIILDDDGQPHVTDFGLAKGLETSLGDEGLGENHATVVLFQRRTADGEILGSPAYMPPEQADGRRGAVGRWSDVYSLGAMLYHLLTGRPPFEGASVTDTLHRLLHDEVVSPRRLNASVPLDLETICLKCIEKDPARRYQTAQELAEELGRFLRDEPVRARPMGRPEKVWRWSRRNPLAAAFVGFVCAALVSSVWLLYLVNWEKNKQVTLNKQLKDSDRANNALLKRTLGMIDENLEGIWGNREKRFVELNSEEIAALAQLPILRVTNASALVRWRMGLITDESPAARVRQHAKLLSELEARASRRLGREVRVDLKLYKFQEDFVAELCAGQIDFARLGALRFLQARRTQPALIPLVMPTAFSKVGLLFTRTNTDIRSLPDVRGHSVAFGDTNSTVSFWAQIKLAEQGITATNLSRLAFLDSTLDFADEVLEVGFTNAVSRIGYLHSHAQVIEGVLGGRYDVGVAVSRAFDIHKGRGLVAIPGSEFQSSRNIWVARPQLDPSFVQALISAMTNLQGRWLEALPDRSLGYEAVPANAYEVEQQWLDRIESLFPPNADPAK